jgi:diguanylate cyclase (GGDEF)-like protein/PAS domain S-box-containing protein
MVSHPHAAISRSMRAPIRVLLIEDSPDDAALIVAALQDSGRPVTAMRVHTLAEILGQLAHDWDVVIIDDSLITLGGLDVIPFIREHASDWPVILVSETVAEERAIASVLAGAADYVLKDGLDRLATTVERVLAETAQRRAEQGRLVHEESFRVLFESNPHPMWIYDRLTREFLGVNKAAVAHYGYTRDEFLSMTIADIRPPEDVGRLLEQDTSREAPLAQHGEWRHRKRDGSIIDVEVTTHLLEFCGRDAVLALPYDVTVRKRAEEELRTSQQRYGWLIRNMRAAILVHDSAGHVTTVNPAACELLGRSERDLLYDPERAPSDNWVVYRNDGTLCPPEERPATRAGHTRMPVRGMIIGVRQPNTGEVVWLLGDAEPEFDSSGALEGVILTFIDITETRRASLALQESEERYRTLVETSMDGVVTIDTTRRITFANAQLAALVGAGIEDLVHGSFECLVPESQRDLVSTELARVYKQGAVNDIRMTLQRRDGTEFSALVSGRLLRTADGSPAGVTATVRDITHQVAYEEQLQHLALHDMLTGLSNRTLLQDRLQQALVTATRDGHSVSLLVLDLDRFKAINDTYGHHYGDLVLQEVARRLVGSLRRSDTVARLGGDEIAIILPDADIFSALQAETKIAHALEVPIDLGSQRFHVGASVGIAIFPDHGEDASTLLRHADVAMYAAKGSNSGFAVYAPHQDSYNPLRLTLISQLRDAIESDQLVMHYQPKLLLSSGVVDGVEALVRWQHPELGLVPPDQFIHLAESSGLIRPLTMWVLRSALMQCRAWRAQNLDLEVAVNLSVRSLHDPELPDIVRALLTDAAVPPSRLTIEITESVIMAEPERALDVLLRLKAIGVRVSIDDFGTGYSSLSYLRTLKADELKIDRSFVIDLDTNSENAFIVRSVIDLGHNLGLHVVAEGIESQVVLDMLTVLTCDRAQGYHLSRPLPPDELVAWLTSPHVA